MMKTTFAVSCPVLCALVLAACQRADDAGSRAPGAAADAASARAAPKQLRDTDVEPFQRELLELAFDAACRFPEGGHDKNRSRAQEQVVIACFELDQPLLALSFAPRVTGWRRGVAYADYAWYSASHGVTANVARYLELAQDVLAQEAKDPNAQAWRGDTIRVKVARAWRALGDEARADAVLRDVTEGSADAIDERWANTVADKVATLTPDTVLGELQKIALAMPETPVGEQFTGLVIMARAHGHFFDDAALRPKLEERLRDASAGLPPDVQLRALRMLAENHLEHGDDAGALRVVGDIADFVGRLQWRPEELIPTLAWIAELRVRAGDRERARSELVALLERYMEARDEITDIYRAETLRPLALVWHELGDAEQVEGLLALVLEEGMENPNSRPRCNDLVETCVDLAKHAIEPSPALWQRLRQIRDGLSDPW